MPIHDWTRVDAGIFHAFHFNWIGEIANTLNNGALPEDYYALPEQFAGGFGPDVLTLTQRDEPSNGSGGGTSPKVGIALATAPPAVRFHISADARRYAAKAKSVAIHHVSNHQVVAIVEILSPGNKSSRSAIDAFLRKARETLAAGVHLMVIDLFPPTIRDPQGIHNVIWDSDNGDEYEYVENKPLICVSYIGGATAEAFLEPVAVGDDLPDMPLFLTPDYYVPIPLESTYESARLRMPAYWRNVLDH